MSLRTLATPLTIGSFIVVCFTGLCLFFGVRGGLVNPIHEISSLVFVLGSVLHIAINWKPTLAHLKRPLGAGLAVLFAVASGLALLPVQGDQESPRQVLGQATELILDAGLAEASAITRQSEQELLDRLAQAGCRNIDRSSTLRGIAQANEKTPLVLLGAVLPERIRKSGE